MSSTNQYDVVWPSGKSTVQGMKLAKRLKSLEGKVVAELWDWVFKGDIMFEAFEAELPKRFPGIKLISWREFGEIHGPRGTAAEIKGLRRGRRHLRGRLLRELYRRRDACKYSC